jgi:hypothetical protein
MVNVRSVVFGVGGLSGVIASRVIGGDNGLVVGLALVLVTYFIGISLRETEGQ